MNIQSILESYLEYDICSRIISKLGDNAIQSYLLAIVNHYSELNIDEGKTNMVEQLEKAQTILDSWIDKEYLSIEKDPETKRIILIPSSIFTIEEIVKSTKRYNILRRRLSKSNLFVRTHSLNEYNNSSFKSRYPIYKLDSVKLVVNPDLVSDSLRLDSLKTKESNPQIELENKLIEQYIKEFSNKTIHMDSKYDTRGRIYTMSYPLSFQSDKYTRSIFELKNKELINEQGLESLLIEIANLIGYDKLTYESRIEKAKEFVSNPNDSNINYDNKARIKSALLAYHNAINCIPSGYLCSIDATSSGNQIMSLLTKNPIESKLTNLSSSNNRYDIYGEVAKEFYRIKNPSITDSELEQFVKENRKIFKESVMTSGYNSESVPKNHFGKDIDIFHKSYSNICKGSAELTKIINQAYTDNRDKPILSWAMPDNFISTMYQQKTSWHMIMGKDNRWSCTIKYYSNAPSYKENKRALAPNFIHSNLFNAVYKLG